MPVMSALKPLKSPFLIFPIIGFAVYLFAGIIAFTLILQTIFTIRVPPAYALFIFVAAIVLKVIIQFIRFKKEAYALKTDRIISNGGSIFSDYSTELILKNVTKVHLHLPYIQNKLFGTGNIHIEAAGSGGTEVSFISIEHPRKVYDELSKLMSSNGFSLDRSKLVQKERPKTIGVFFEVFSIVVYAAVFVLAIGLNVVTTLIEQLANLGLIFSVLSYVLIIGFLGFLVFRFMDLKRRVYYLYKDVIDYEDGFFTENYMFIPIQNLADAQITQTIISRLFGLYDVLISSQGAGNDITFTSMINGQTFKDNLVGLIRTSKPSTTTTKKATTAKVVNKKKTSGHRMHWPRAILVPFASLTVLLFVVLTAAVILGIMFSAFWLATIPFILLGYAFLAITTVVSSGIQVYATRYWIDENQVEQAVNFLNKQYTTFTYDKITGITVTESIIDKIFGTHSITFMSIGSDKDLSFTHVKKTLRLHVKAISRFPKEPFQVSTPSFSFPEFFKKNLFMTVLAVIFIVGTSMLSFIYPGLWPAPALIALAYGGIFIYRGEFSQRVTLENYKTWVKYTEGIFIKSTTYAYYRNIKDIETMQYPWSMTGSIQYNIAGEIALSQRVKRSNGFQMHYLPQVLAFHDATDKILHNHPMKGTTKKPYDVRTLISEKPMVANSLTTLVVVSIILFPMLLILPLNATILVIRVRRITYFIQSSRAVRTSGILFRNKISILNNRIDHMHMAQGFLNKLYKNGNVTMFTAGSSTPELMVRSVKQYKQMYKAVEKQY